jgi:hypothetical protein
VSIAAETWSVVGEQNSPVGVIRDRQVSGDLTQVQGGFLTEAAHRPVARRPSTGIVGMF